MTDLMAKQSRWRVTAHEITVPLGCLDLSFRLTYADWQPVPRDQQSRVTCKLYDATFKHYSLPGILVAQRARAHVV